MKHNKTFVLGMLAVHLAFGLVLVSCATDQGQTQTTSGSTLTVTGLDAYNGKYCWAWGYIDGLDILASSPSTYWRDDGDNWAPGVLVANGSVTLILQFWGGDAGQDDAWLPFMVADDKDLEFTFWVAISENNLNDTGIGSDIVTKFSGGVGTGVFVLNE